MLQGCLDSAFRRSHYRTVPLKALSAGKVRLVLILCKNIVKDTLSGSIPLFLRGVVFPPDVSDVQGGFREFHLQQRIVMAAYLAGSPLADHGADLVHKGERRNELGSRSWLAGGRGKNLDSSFR